MCVAILLPLLTKIPRHIAIDDGLYQGDTLKGTINSMRMADDAMDQYCIPFSLHSHSPLQPSLTISPSRYLQNCKRVKGEIEDVRTYVNVRG